MRATTTRKLPLNSDSQRSVDTVRIEDELREMRWRRSQADSELLAYEDLDVDQVGNTIEEIRRNLAAQSKLQEDIFLEVKTRVHPFLRRKRCSRAHLVIAFVSSSRRNPRATSTPSKRPALMHRRYVETDACHKRSR